MERCLLAELAKYRAETPKKGKAATFGSFGALAAINKEPVDKEKIVAFLERSLALVTSDPKQSKISQAYAALRTPLQDEIREYETKKTAIVEPQTLDEMRRRQKSINVEFMSDRRIQAFSNDVNESFSTVENQLRNPRIPAIYVLKDVLITTDKRRNYSFGAADVFNSDWGEDGTKVYEFDGHTAGHAHDLVHFQAGRMLCADVIVEYLKHVRANER